MHEEIAKSFEIKPDDKDISGGIIFLNSLAVSE